MTDEKDDVQEVEPEPPHPLDGGIVHDHHVPEQLTEGDRLKRQAAAEEHTDQEQERGFPPRGKL